jgi:hypothetical protein
MTRYTVTRSSIRAFAICSGHCIGKLHSLQVGASVVIHTRLLNLYPRKRDMALVLYILGVH